MIFFVYNYFQNKSFILKARFLCVSMSLLVGLMDAKAQSLQIEYQTGGSMSLYGRDPKWNDYIVGFKNSVYPFVNYVGNASIGINLFKERLNLNLGYNQLVYAYGIRTFYTYPDYFATKEGVAYRSSLYTHAISFGAGPNIKVSPKITFHPFLNLYLRFKAPFSPVEDVEYAPIPNEDGTVSMATLKLKEELNIKNSFLMGVGFKFNFFIVKNWLYISTGMRYARGFKKDFSLTYSMDVNDKNYYATRQLRGSFLSIDAGIGVKLNLKKKNGNAIQ